MGKKTWHPGKNLERFIAAQFGIAPREQAAIVEQISDAVPDTAPLVRDSMKEHPGFRDLGKRILTAWAEGVSGLRDKRFYGMSGWIPGDAFKGLSDPPNLKAPKRVMGGE